MRYYTIGLTAFLLFLSLACTRQEEVLIPDNVAPPDETIADIVVESYINRAYISVLDRKADENEFDAAFTLLRRSNIGTDDRLTFVNDLLDNPSFTDNLFETNRVLLLGGVDTTDIQSQIDVYNLLLNDPQYQDLYSVIILERDRLISLLNSPDEMRNGTLTLPELHHRMIQNVVYDELNMGTQNFVISLYQNFLFRYPTDAERVAAETMVDGFPSIAFLQTGRSKEDFIDIFFNSPDYHEGQVRDVYTRFLFREPDTEELATLSVDLRNTGDYKALLREIMTSDEFIGL